MKTLVAFDSQFPDEDSCKRYLQDCRWPDGAVKCPRCGHEKVFAVKSRPFHWVCKSGKTTTDHEGKPVTCGRNGYRFSVITRTIFQDTKYPLTVWFKVAYFMLVSKKGVSAHQMYRTMALNGETSDYHTFWFMCMRLRAAMRNEEWPLAGQVEIDEVYIGGKNENRHWNKRKELHGRGAVGKTAVMGAIARKGNVICRVLQDTTAETTNQFVRQMVSEKVDLVATDEGAAYKRLAKMGIPHETVDHKAHEYVRGEVHTNNIENFWSLLKRGVVGTYHNVSADYLPLYLNEFSFRHNFRHHPDAFRQLIRSC